MREFVMQRTGDDCIIAALAYVFNAPYETLEGQEWPEDFLTEQGFVIQAPVDPNIPLWVGSRHSVLPGTELWNKVLDAGLDPAKDEGRHAVVMARDYMLYDPDPGSTHLTVLDECLYQIYPS